MKNFKKRTIALVLASVVTVAGSFASERFKNSLMALSFETAENGTVSMVVQTKTNFSGNLTPMKRDANTYVLTLPEMDSQAPTPDLTQNPHIESVNIRTMPYTNSGNGYTRITIKTNNLQFLPVQQRLYIAEKKNERLDKKPRQEKRIERNTNEERLSKEQQLEKRKQEIEKRRAERQKQEEEMRAQQEALRQKQLAERQEQAKLAQEASEQMQEENAPIPDNNQLAQGDFSGLENDPVDISSTYATTEENNEAFFLSMAILLILLISVFCYFRAKEKVIELSGESMEIDIDNGKSKKKSSKKLNKIKNTIKTLDSAYAKSAVIQKSEYTPSSENTPIEAKEEAREVNVVDLDKLFQEKIQAEKQEKFSDNEDENKALEDFLSGFSFDEEFGDKEPEELFDVELFEKIINGNYSFSKDDINCINNLLNLEIDNNTLKNAKDYLVTKPIKQDPKNKILEDLITTYAIKQDITFTQKDVEALEKLINFELDSNFVTDLRTNPERTKEVQAELIKAKSKVRKPSEMLTLKVSDALPNLSEELKQNGNNRIKSEYKPDTVYFSKGYEVETLNIAESLPDLSKEINNEEAYISKPSAKVEIVDNSYTVSTLSISSDLPNLSEAIKDPTNFVHKEKESVEADEEAMLKNIAHVQFKPFSDDTNNFETLNDFDDFYAIDDSDPNDMLSQEEVEAEFEKLYSIQDPFAEDIATQRNSVKKHIEENKNKIESENQAEIQQKIVNNEIKRERPNASEEIMKKIQERREKRADIVQARRQIQPERKTLRKEETEKTDIICNIENESFTVLSTVKLTEDKGCHLAKNNNGYAVICYIEDKLSKIKTYSELKSEKIQARLSEKINENTFRYIVRIGLNKFILDVKNDDIEYVMDLC